MTPLEVLCLLPALVVVLLAYLADRDAKAGMYDDDD
jgi:hypothetical protein